MVRRSASLSHTSAFGATPRSLAAMRPTPSPAQSSTMYSHGPLCSHAPLAACCACSGLSARAAGGCAGALACA
eukprot:6321739-Alexandrium_andersonii.AAC.1